MDEIWWQKLLCEFHVVKKPKVRKRGCEGSSEERMEDVQVMWRVLIRGGSRSGNIIEWEAVTRECAFPAAECGRLGPSQHASQQASRPATSKIARGMRGPRPARSVGMCLISTYGVLCKVVLNGDV